MKKIFPLLQLVIKNRVLIQFKKETILAFMRTSLSIVHSIFATQSDALFMGRCFP
jgi:hypothetical protein